MALECKLISYDAETCRLVGEIIHVSAEERILDDKAKSDPANLKPIVFDPVNHTFLKLVKKVGNAFRDGIQLK